MKWWRKQNPFTSLNQRGFTIIEMVVVLVIIGILTGIAISRYGSAETDARDAERKTDVESIAKHFETLFSKTIYDSASAIIKQDSSYPSTSLVTSFAAFDGIDDKALRAPGVSTDQSVSVLSASDTTDPQPTIDQYIYQPLNNSGGLCTTNSGCRSFTIFYRTESDDTVRKVTSLRQ